MAEDLKEVLDVDKKKKRKNEDISWLGRANRVNQDKVIWLENETPEVSKLDEWLSD